MSLSDGEVENAGKVHASKKEGLVGKHDGQNVCAAEFKHRC